MYMVNVLGKPGTARRKNSNLVGLLPVLSLLPSLLKQQCQELLRCSGTFIAT